MVPLAPLDLPAVILFDGLVLKEEPSQLLEHDPQRVGGGPAFPSAAVGLEHVKADVGRAVGSPSRKDVGMSKVSQHPPRGMREEHLGCGGRVLGGEDQTELDLCLRERFGEEEQGSERR